MLRRTVYLGSLLAVGALLDELAFFVLSRHPLHVADRGFRSVGHPTKKAAADRGREHIAEHEAQEAPE